MKKYLALCCCALAIGAYAKSTLTETFTSAAQVQQTRLAFSDRGL